MAERRSEELIKRSREEYATPRAEVEAEFNKQWQESGAESASDTKDTAHEEKKTTKTEEAVSKPKRSARNTPEPISVEVPALGKGGRQHKYLQEMVKRLAEDKGFMATIEKPVLGGKGSVDVALERNGINIACEISVSTTSEQELGNIQKCLASGFEKIFCSRKKKNILPKPKS